MKQTHLTLVAASLCVVLAGCASNTSFLQEQAKLEPEQWTAQMPRLEAPSLLGDKTWWQAWNNPELTLLLQAAADNNTDVLTAMANLRSAAALADDATAKLFPSLTASGQGRGDRANGDWTEGWQASASATWSISLAGENIAARRAANLEAMASAMTLEDTRIAVAAEVAQTYVSLRLAYVQKLIAEMTLSNYKQAADIARWNFDAGLGDKTEVDQAISNEENARAQIPLIEQSIDKYRNALARLTGQAVGTLEVKSAETVPAAPMALAISLPAETLKQRPDMRSAFYALQAASDRVYEARSQWFPTLNLSGNIGTQAATISTLGASGAGIAGIVAALSLPLLDWGTQVTATEQQLAALDKARANYTKTLLSALEQTENAIVGITTAQSRADALERALAAAESAAELAMQQYSAGLTDYQTVLNTQRTLYTVRGDEQSNKADLATQLIALYRAMGGGWKAEATQKSEAEHNFKTTPTATAG